MRPNLSISLSSVPLNPNERSVMSFEKEIMRLQEVLKDREAEISVLEISLKESQESRVTTHVPTMIPNSNTSGPSGVSTSYDATLSPKTLNQFDHIRKSMENGNGNGHITPPDHFENGSEMNGSSVFSETDESLERLNELML